MKRIKLSTKQKQVIKEWRFKTFGSCALRAYLELSDYVQINPFSTLEALERKGLCALLWRYAKV